MDVKQEAGFGDQPLKNETNASFQKTESAIFKNQIEESEDDLGENKVEESPEEPLPKL